MLQWLIHDGPTIAWAIAIMFTGLVEPRLDPLRSALAKLDPAAAAALKRPQSRQARAPKAAPAAEASSPVGRSRNARPAKDPAYQRLERAFPRTAGTESVRPRDPQKPAGGQTSPRPYLKAPNPKGRPRRS